MEKRESLVQDGVYHIYNHGTSSDNIFRSEENYLFFMGKHDKYMPEVWDCLSYCLMPNHFHFLIRVKDEKLVSRCYSHFTNSYVQAFNKQWSRRGALFMHRFRRKRLNDEIYLKNLVCYIHNNPVNHGFTNSAYKWKHSSYRKIIFNPTDKLNQEVITLFGDLKNFKAVHRMNAGADLAL